MRLNCFTKEDFFRSIKNKLEYFCRILRHAQKHWLITANTL